MSPSGTGTGPLTRYSSVGHIASKCWNNDIKDSNSIPLPHFHVIKKYHHSLLRNQLKYLTSKLKNYGQIMLVIKKNIIYTILNIFYRRSCFVRLWLSGLQWVLVKWTLFQNSYTAHFLNRLWDCTNRSRTLVVVQLSIKTIKKTCI